MIKNDELPSHLMQTLYNMNLYKHHTDREIVAVLDQSAKLTYDAQRNLLKELRARSVAASTSDLEKHLEEKEEAIQNLNYLKDLGFHYEFDQNTGTIKVTRAKNAIVMDVVSIVIGALLFTLGLIYFWLLIQVFFGDNEFSLGGLFTYILVISAGMIGFKMLSGINRFLDYNNFLLTQSNDTLTIRKGGLDGEQEFLVTKLILEQEEEELVLSIGDIEIMRSTEDNLVHKKTLEALVHKLMTNR